MQREGKTLVRGYRWTTTRHSESRVGPKLYTGKTNQAVYIRGFKIAVRPEPPGRRHIIVKADHPSGETCWEEFSETIDVQEADEARGDASGNSAYISNGNAQGKGTSRITKHVSVQSMPQVSDESPFHPSDVINKYLLQKAPSATVAITHDSQWAALLKSAGGELEPWGLGDEHLMVEALLKQYEVASKDGVVFLQGAVDTDDTLGMEGHAREVTFTKQKDGGVFLQSAVGNTDALDIRGHIKEEAFTSRQRRLSIETPNIMGKNSKGRTLTLLRGHEGFRVPLVVFVSEDHIISASDQDRTIQQWTYSDGRWYNEVLKETASICGITTSPDCRLVAYGGAEGQVSLIDLQTRKVTTSNDRHVNMVQSVSFSPDSNQLASGARDGTVLLWTLNPLQPTAKPSKRHSDSVWCIRYSPDGRKIASCDRQIIQIQDFHTTRSKLCITERAWSLAWSTSSEGCFLLAGCIDGTLMRFDPDTGETLTICKAHQDVIFSIALPHNANFIATASWDKTVRFWETTTFQEIVSCLQHHTNVYSISISPSDDYLVSGARDSVVRVWNLKAIVPTLFCPIPLRLVRKDTFRRQVHFADPSPSSPYPSPSDSNSHITSKKSQGSLQRSDGENPENKSPLKPRLSIPHLRRKRPKATGPWTLSPSSQESSHSDSVPAGTGSSPSSHFTEQSNLLSPTGHSRDILAPTRLPSSTSQGNDGENANSIRKIRPRPSDLIRNTTPEGSGPVSGGSHGDDYGSMIDIDAKSRRSYRKNTTDVPTTRNAQEDLISLQRRIETRSRQLNEILPVITFVAELDRQKRLVASKMNALVAVRKELDKFPDVSHELDAARIHHRDLNASFHDIHQQNNNRIQYITSTITAGKPKLPSIHQFIADSDVQAENAIIRTLCKLNAEVQRILKSISTYFINHTQSPDPEGQSSTLRRACESIPHYLIEQLCTLSHYGLRSHLPIALQTCLASHLYSHISSWTTHKATDKLIRKVRDDLRGSEPQLFAAGWGSLAATNIQDGSDNISDILFSRIMQGLSDVIVTAGCASSVSDAEAKMSLKFFHDITSIISTAEQLRQSIREVLAVDFKVVIHPSGRMFDKTLMVVDPDAGSGMPPGGKILCTTRLGLIKEVIVESPDRVQKNTLTVSMVVKAAIVLQGRW